MRILIHFGTSYLDNVPNSIRMTTFAHAFIEAGHQVCVISPKNGIVVKYDEIKLVSCPMYHPKKHSALRRLVSHVSFGIISFFAALGAGKADVVITGSPPALLSPAGWLIAKFKRAALVYDVRDIWPDVAVEMGAFKAGSFYERCFRFVRDFMTKRADLITTVTPGKVEKLKGYPRKSDVLFVTNGFNEDFLKHDEDAGIIEKYRLNQGFICVYIGKLGLAQGLGQLLDLAERSRRENISARFLLFGNGVEEATLKEQAKKRKLDNVEFCGRVPNAKIFTVLHNANLCYISLVNEKLTDSVPTKLFEALGVGCPVLLSACGDAADVLNKTGLGASVTPNDEESLWRAFCDMYQKDDWSKEKQTARELMTSVYSRQRVAEKLERELSQRFEERKKRGKK